jgi:hypothetical protein
MVPRLLLLNFSGIISVDFSAHCPTGGAACQVRSVWRDLACHPQRDGHLRVVSTPGPTGKQLQRPPILWGEVLPLRQWCVQCFIGFAGPLHDKYGMMEHRQVLWVACHSLLSSASSFCSASFLCHCLLCSDSSLRNMSEPLPFSILSLKRLRSLQIMSCFLMSWFSIQKVLLFFPELKSNDFKILTVSTVIT